MDQLRWSDHRKIATFARGLYALGSVRAVSERVVQGMDALIGCNSALVVHHDHKVKTQDIWAENVGSDLQRFAPTLWALRHEHPGFKNLRLYATQTTTLSDLMPFSRWRKTALYNEVYAELGMQEQLAGVFPFARPALAGVVLNRNRRTFTPRDRFTLNLLRFHISEACRSARVIETNPVAVTAEAFAPLVDGGTLVLDRAGTVLYASAAAQSYLGIFFAADKPFRSGLPATVERWVRRELDPLGTDALALRPLKTLLVRRGENALQVRLSSAPNRSAHVLLLQATGPGYDVEKLESLGLGPRASEVLYWVAQGKTNEETGIILGISTGVVKNHVKGILVRLGVENRTGAAATALALLSRPTGHSG